MKALILAAGKSTRIASSVPSKPKPLIEVDGKPVLIHNLELLKKHGIVDVWINLHYEPDQIRAAVGDGSRWGVSVRYSEEKDILGTAGAVKKLDHELDGAPFWVLYGDNYTDCDLGQMAAFHAKAQSDATIAAFDFDRNPNSRIAGGKMECGADGRVRQFLEGEKADSSASRLVNAGIYLLEPSLLDQFPSGFSDFGKDLFPALLKKQKKIYAYTMSGFCFAIDTPEAMQKTREFLPQRKL